MPYLRIDIDDHERDGVRTLRMSGELDMAAVPTLEATVRRVCEHEQTRAITLDLSGLGFIDSTGLAAIVLVSSICAKRGFAFELVPGSRSVQEPFEAAGLIDALPFRRAAAADRASRD